jgi:itaconate CoA-transferase
MYAFSAVLTALFVRQRSGQGAALEVSLFDSLAEWMSQPMYYTMYTGVPPARTGTSHATIAPYGTFRTGGGGAVQLAVQNDREWQRLCSAVLGRPGLLDDARYRTNPLRVENRQALTADIEAAFADVTADDVIDRLDGARIANGHFNDVRDLLAHPQLAAGHRWCEVDSPVGPVRALRPPVRMEGVDPVMGPVPGVGDQTEAVLSELGYTAVDIDRLRAQEAI